MKLLWVALIALFVPLAPHAQTAEHPPCWHAEFDSLSFLAGEWVVRAEDRLEGGKWETTDARCWITREMKGCAMSQRYVGTRQGKRFEARGMYGFDSVNGKLQHMTIDDEHGMLTTYAGSRVGNDIVLDFAMDLRGHPVILREVISSTSPDAFRVENSRSNDGGKTWDVTSKRAYTRAPAVVAAALPSIELPAELARVLTDYETGWSAKDEAALAALFTEDGFVLPGGQAPVRGRAAIQEHYKDSGGSLSLRALAYGIDGTTGYIIGAYAGAKGAPDDGKFTLTLRKETDRWLIVSDMDNSNRR